MSSFYEIIKSLEEYWSEYGCNIMLPYTSELGAGTLHPATITAAVKSENCKIAYIQPVIRPADGRYGKNPNRLYMHHQYQVLITPSPDDLQQLYLKSLQHIGIDIFKHDIRFIEDNWENPSIGAWGLGWEVWCDGMEISQFTYMQQVGGISLKKIPGELAYGMERIAMYIQDVDSVYDIKFDKTKKSYAEVFTKPEHDFSCAALDFHDKEVLFTQFEQQTKLVGDFLAKSIPFAAYDQCTKASHTLNLLDSMGFISVSERAKYILAIRSMVKDCCMMIANGGQDA